MAEYFNVVIFYCIVVGVKTTLLKNVSTLYQVIRLHLFNIKTVLMVDIKVVLL